MAYADIIFYNDEYKGQTVLLDDDENKRLLERGSDWIDVQTRDKITRFEFDNLNDFQQKMVQYSNCAWVESTLINGEVNLSGTNDLSFKLGDYSQTSSGGTSEKAVYQRALQYLDRSGLTNKACGGGVNLNGYSTCYLK